jgi:hypothetical protein
MKAKSLIADDGVAATVNAESRLENATARLRPTTAKPDHIGNVFMQTSSTYQR